VSAGAALRADRAELANGLTLLGEHNPGAQTVAAGFFVRTGARDERPELLGVSHFLEHMMFKGTEQRSADDINREFDELGARYNAYTSEDRTVYYGAVLPERADGLIDLLSDMMRPTLRSEDFEVEKRVILEEIAMYDDRPASRLFDLAHPLYFRDHPVGNVVLGTNASIEALERDAMAAYHRARYAANNLVFVIAGRYDWKRVVAQLERVTAGWGRDAAERAHPPFDASAGHHEITDASLARVHLAAFAPGVASNDPRRFAASLLASCLGAGGSGALHWALVDPGLVDSAALWHEAADGLGTFIGYVSSAPERFDEVVARFREVLATFERDGPDPDAWSRAQRKLATALTLRAETPFGRLMSLGNSFLDRGSYEPLADVVEGLLSADPSQGLELLAERPFARLFTVALGPGRGGA
jgi:predicted Zn-dependent peptidase